MNQDRKHNYVPVKSGCIKFKSATQAIQNDLKKHSKKSFKDIAKQYGVTPAMVTYAYKKLVKDGTIAHDTSIIKRGRKIIF